MLSLNQRPAGGRGTVSVPLVVILSLAIVGVLLVLALNSRWARHEPQNPVLTPEAKAYVHDGYLKLDDVQMNATESFAKQMLVEVTGKITNTGHRPLRLVEIYCVFHDPYGQVVLRQRLPIAAPRNGGLKPGETKPFRLPFDELPGSWNQTLPDLVIAQIAFE
jgi:hypothetical protein